MPGEPAWFDVKKLECMEIETTTGDAFPSNIIDWGEKFFLKATFEGPHAVSEWHNMTDGELEYTAKFYGEGIGPGVTDKDFGTITGKLQTEKYTYEVESPTTSVTADGVWRCGVTVTFRQHNGRRYHGVLGFNVDCVVQISKFEEPH